MSMNNKPRAPPIGPVSRKNDRPFDSREQDNSTNGGGKNFQELWPEVINVPRNEWIFSKSDLVEKTPSRLLRKPIGYKEEISYRAKAVQRIIEFANSLKLARRTVVAASVYINRYYMFNDFLSSDYKQVVAACVFIATKSEENLKSIKTVATQLAVIYKPNTPMDELDSVIWKNIDAIKNLENKILRDLRFDLIIEMPFDIIEDVFLELGLKDYPGYEGDLETQLTRVDVYKSKEAYVRQFNWLPEVIIYTSAYVLFNSHEIASTAIILTFINMKKRLPKMFLQKYFGVGLVRIEQCIKYLKEVFEYLKTVDIKIHTNANQLALFNVTMDDLIAAIDDGDEEDITTGHNEHGYTKPSQQLDHPPAQPEGLEY